MLTIGTLHINIAYLIGMLIGAIVILFVLRLLLGLFGVRPPRFVSWLVVIAIMIIGVGMGSPNSFMRKHSKEDMVQQSMKAAHDVPQFDIFFNQHPDAEAALRMALERDITDENKDNQAEVKNILIQDLKTTVTQYNNH